MKGRRGGQREKIHRKGRERRECRKIERGTEGREHRRKERILV